MIDPLSQDAMQMFLRPFDAGVSFDYISDWQLLSLPPKGKTHYATIVIPPCQTIPLATATRLGELARKGCRVMCVGERPRDVLGLIWPQDPDAIRRAMKGVADARIETIGRREPFTGKSGLAYRRLRRGKDVLGDPMGTVPCTDRTDCLHLYRADCLHFVNGVDTRQCLISPMD